MTEPSGPGRSGNAKTTRAEERRRRLAEALRQNLGRRKAQARARAAAAAEKPQTHRDGDPPAES